MKQKGLFIFIFVMALLAFFFLNKKIDNKNDYKNFSIINYQLQTTNYKLLVADTPEKWQKGLMYYRKLEGVDGMIFLFPDKDYRSFWNKNTYMDLDLYWLDGDMIVGKDFLPSIEKSKETVLVNSPQEVNKVIEIPRTN